MSTSDEFVKGYNRMTKPILVLDKDLHGRVCLYAIETAGMLSWSQTTPFKYTCFGTKYGFGASQYGSRSGHA